MHFLICSSFTAWALSLLFFHTVMSRYFLNSASSVLLPHFYLVLLYFLHLLFVSYSVRFYFKLFYLVWNFCPDNEIWYAYFVHLLGQDCSSTTRTFCCPLAFTLELDFIENPSSFSCCSHIAPLHLLLENLRVSSSKAIRIPIALSSASP